MSTQEYRRGIANMVLGSFESKVLLYDTEGRGLRMCWPVGPGLIWPPKYDFTARLQADGRWPKYGFHHRPCGGTGMQAVAQMIRYVRDLPRLPLSCWLHWAGPTVQLASPRTLEILKASDYGNPQKTCCVLCGSIIFGYLVDWWSVDGITGPCCRAGQCVPWATDPKVTADTRFSAWLREYRKQRTDNGKTKRR